MITTEPIVKEVFYRNNIYNWINISYTESLWNNSELLFNLKIAHEPWFRLGLSSAWYWLLTIAAGWSGKILGSVTDEEFLGLNSFVHAVGLSGP